MFLIDILFDIVRFRLCGCVCVSMCVHLFVSDHELEVVSGIAERALQTLGGKVNRICGGRFGGNCLV